MYCSLTRFQAVTLFSSDTGLSSLKTVTEVGTSLVGVQEVESAGSGSAALAAGVSAEVGTTTAAASASTDRARVKVGQDIRGLSRQIVGGGPSPLAEGADRGLPGAQTSRGRVPGDLP